MRKFQLCVLAALFSALPATGCIWILDSPEELEAEIAELRQRVAAEPTDAEAWSNLVLNVGMLGQSAAMELDAEALGQEAFEERSRELVEASHAEALAVIDEWLATAPDEPQAYLLRAGYLEADPAAVEATLRDLTGRLKHRVEGFRALAEHLGESDRVAEGTALLEEFLAAHLDLPDAYAALVEHLEEYGDPAAEEEVARSWQKRFPDHPAVLEHRMQTGDLTRQELQATLRRLMETAKPSELLPLCELLLRLESDDLVGLAAECTATVAGQQDDPEAADAARSSLYQALSEAGEWDAAARLVADDGDRQRAESHRLSLAAQAAQNGACTAARPLVASLDVDALDAKSRLKVAFVESRCGDEEKGRALATAFASTESAEQLRQEWLFEILGPDRLLDVLYRRLDATPDDTGLLETLSGHLKSSGSFEQRLSLLLTWTDLDPTNPSPPAQLAALFEQRGELEPARQFYEEALRRDPESQERHEDLLEVLLASGQPERARQLAEGLLASEEEARRRQGHFLMARIAQQEGRPADAAHHFAAVLAGGVDNAPWEALNDYPEALKQAGLFEDLEAYLKGQAEEFGYGTSPDADPAGTFQTIDGYVAESLENLELEERALPYARRAVEMAPQDADAHARLGRLFQALGQVEAAETSLRRAVGLDPRWYLSDLTGLYAAQGRHEDLVALLEPAAEGWTLQEPSLLLLADAYGALGRFGDQIALLRSVLERDEDSYNVQLVLGRALEAQGESRDARRYFKQFLDGTAPLAARAGSSCDCYCEVLSTRAEIAAKLDEGDEETRNGAN